MAMHPELASEVLSCPGQALPPCTGGLVDMVSVCRRSPGGTASMTQPALQKDPHPRRPPTSQSCPFATRQPLHHPKNRRDPHRPPPILTPGTAHKDNTYPHSTRARLCFHVACFVSPFFPRACIHSRRPFPSAIRIAPAAPANLQSKYTHAMRFSFGGVLARYQIGVCATVYAYLRIPPCSPGPASSCRYLVDSSASVSTLSPCQHEVLILIEFDWALVTGIYTSRRPYSH